LAGDWRVDELDELLELLEELEDEPDEPEEPEELVPDELVPEELVPDEPVPDVVPDELDELLLVDDPESLTEAWVAPGRTATSAPAAATLAKDAVTVVAVSRRRPCSRSATARASRRPLSRLSMSTSLPRPAEEPVRARSQNPLRPNRRALLGHYLLESWGNAQRRLYRRLPRGP
jgi:hypothetical protein